MLSRHPKASGGYPLPWDAAWRGATSSQLSPTVARTLPDGHGEGHAGKFGESLEILIQISTAGLLEAAQ